MANYSTIKGFTIQSLASDPSAPGVAGATWASGATINTARQDIAAFGNPVATTAVIAGGTTGLITEEYNGTVWAESGDLTGTATGGAGSAGTVTAGVYFGGSFGPPGNSNITQKYDGTSWTTSGTMNTTRRAMASGGIQTAAFAALGATTPTFVTAAETYNGTAWTSVNSCLTARRSGAGSGTITAALAFGGYTVPGAIADQTETYNGTSWSEANDLNTGRTSLAGSRSGTNTAALAMGGDTPPATAITEYFDGTSWTEVADLSRARVAGGSGTSTDAFIAGGSPEPSPATYTNESEFFSTGTSIAQEGQVWYNTTSTVLKGFGQQGTGAWASATSMPIGLEYGGLAGIQTAAVFWGGVKSPPGSPVNQNTTFEYDGTSWTAGNSTPTACANTGGVGTQTAAAGFGNEAGYTALTMEYDGTSWAAGNNRPFIAGGSANFGTQTAAISATGYNPGSGVGGNLVDVAHYDGTSWTTGTNFPTNTSAAMGAGSQTAGVVWGGYAPGVVTTTTTYDGTTWSPSGAMGTARFSGTGGGSQTAAITAGGGPATVNTEIFNGSTWTEVANLGTKAQYQAKGFSHTAAATLGFISAGGSHNPPGFVATVEEYTVPDAIKTFTAS